MISAVTRSDKKRMQSVVSLRSDERLRKELQDRGCDWEPLQEVCVADIQIADNEFQTRLDVATADREVIDKYKERMLAGDRFPELLLAADRRSRTSGKRTFRIVCGKHRLVAMLELGIASFNALVMWINDDSDKAKARDISIHDNVANGKPVSNEVMHEQIARECISESGGFAGGHPDARVIRSVCERHGITKPDYIKKHIQRLLFQHECRARKLVPPAGVDVCAAAYSFVDKGGFGEIVQAVCRHGESKGLPGVLKDCSRRRQCGAAVVKAITDHAAGYSPARQRSPAMSSVDRARLMCDALVKHLEHEVHSDSSLTLRDCDMLDDYLSIICERGASVVSVIRKKAKGA